MQAAAALRDGREETDAMCTVCGKPMVFRGHDDVWVCDTCHRCVCWRCKTSILPPIDAETPRMLVQCDTCREASTAIEDVDSVRNRLTDLYRGAQPGTVVEIEIGDALQSVRTAMKRLRKAREELVNQPLPGM